MAHDIPAVLTWNVCWPVVGGIPWQVVHDDGTVVGIVVGTVVGGTVVAVVVVDVAGVVVGTVVRIVVVGTVVVAVVVAVVVVDVAGVVVGTVVVVAPGFGFGSPTFQLRLETGKLTNPADVTVKLPRREYVVPVTV